MTYMRLLLIQMLLVNAGISSAADAQEQKKQIFVVRTIKNVGTNSVASIVFENCLVDGYDKKDASNYVALFKTLLHPPVRALCCLCGTDEPGQKEDVYWLIPEKYQESAPWRSWVHTGHGQATLVKNGNAVYMTILRNNQEEHLQKPLIEFADVELQDAQVVELLLKIDTKGNHTLSRVSSSSSTQILMSPPPARRGEGEPLLAQQPQNYSYGAPSIQHHGSGAPVDYQQQY